MTEDKLSFLAKKEEELRKLNEQLSEKQKLMEADEKDESPHSESDSQEHVLSKDEELEELPQDLGKADKSNEDDLEDIGDIRDHKEIDAENDQEKIEQFEEDKKPSSSIPTTTKSKVENVLPEEENNDNDNDKKSAEEDPEFEKNLLEVKKYQEVMERCAEHERTIALQKAKIETLELELQNSISNLNAKDLQINELESKDKSLSDQSKKYNTQINQLNVSMQKLKQQNTEYLDKIEGLEKELAQLRQEANKSSQAKEKASQESHGKDVKYIFGYCKILNADYNRINRMIEELEKYKKQLREVKSSDGQKTDEHKKDAERLLQVILIILL